MKARPGLGLSAAALAWVCFTHGAFAIGQPQPNNTTGFYSAESVLLTPNSNQVALSPNNFFYFVLNGPVAPGPVNFIAPAGNNFTFPAAGIACQRDGVPYAFALGTGTNTITCPSPGVAFTTLNLITFPAGTTNVITLTGPNVVALGNPIQPGGGALGPNPTAVVQINASGPGDSAAGIPNFSIISRNSFSIVLTPQNLGIDLSGAGLPNVFPGAGFKVNPPTSGAATVSIAGFLGTFWINENQFDLDARNGLNSISAIGAGTNGPLTGNTTVTLAGDFATITNAYLVPNNAGPPTANMSTACLANQPNNAIGGATTINAGKNLITFPPLPTPANNAGNSNSPVFAVCLVTNGTQVIQAPSNVQITASVAITGAPAGSAAVGLTVPNSTFASITYEGSAFFVQNVLGFNNGAETFFRIVNSSNTVAPVWAVLTKDVPNTSPEVGAGSCNFPAGPSPTAQSATLAPQPVPPNVVNTPTTCNVSFVAGLRSGAVAGLPDVISTNTTGGGPNGGLVQPNNATYVTGDDIAVLAGTSLNPASAATGSLHATVWLLSPNAGVRFSALAQSTTFGVIIPTQ
jgi:hypothetical protein